MNSFEELLDESTRIHGHICAGQVIGVRMSMAGLERIGIADPKGADRKKLYVLVEIDRCATDAIQSVTGCSLGKRSMRWMDFGIMAATFVNLETNLAYRVISTENSRELAAKYAPYERSPKQQQLIGYQTMPDDQLFDIQQVHVPLADTEMPGPPKHHAMCEHCGQMVRDGKEIIVKGRVYCRPCSDKSYFTIIDPYWLPEQRGILKENVLS